LFFRLKKADHLYWKLINHALTWARPNLFLSIFMPVAPMLQHVVFVYLANTAVLCYSLTMICCCQVQNYIYWIISTENDHRHHHKFIKYEKRLRKEGNMLGLPIKPNFCHFSVSLDAQHFLQFVPTVQLIPYIYPAFVPFGRYCTSIPLYLWIHQSPLSSTCWHILFHMLCIVSKQCACSRRVHIEGHMNSQVKLNSCHHGI
jgi:hypothetical protein